MRNRIFKIGTSNSVSSEARDLFIAMFVKGGLNLEEGTFNGRPINVSNTAIGIPVFDQQKSYEEKYLTDWRTMLFSLAFNLHDLSGYGIVSENNQTVRVKLGQSFENIGRNLVGWDANAQGIRKYINYLFTPVTLVFSLALAVPKLALNLLRLAVVFPLQLLANLLDRASQERVYDVVPDEDWVETSPDPKATTTHRAMLMLSKVAAVVVKIPLFIFKAILDPKNNMLYALDEGQRLVNGTPGKLLGGVLAGVSLFLSITTYTAASIFFFPVVLQQAVASLPGFVAMMGNFIGGTAASVFGITSIPASQLGIGLLFSTLASAVLPVVTALKDKMVDQWYQGENHSPSLPPSRNHQGEVPPVTDSNKRLDQITNEVKELGAQFILDSLAGTGVPLQEVGDPFGAMPPAEQQQSENTVRAARIADKKPVTTRVSSQSVFAAHPVAGSQASPTMTIIRRRLVSVGSIA